MHRAHYPATRPAITASKHTVSFERGVAKPIEHAAFDTRCTPQRAKPTWII